MSIRIERPDEARLIELGVAGWSAWECEPSEFDWEYAAEETCYLHAGRVTVTPTDGSGAPVEFGPGDLVTFPRGLRCRWKVSEPVRKVYRFA